MPGLSKKPCSDHYTNKVPTCDQTAEHFRGGQHCSVAISGDRIPSAQDPGMATSKRSSEGLVRRWWRVARIWFTGEDKWAARTYVAVVLGLALLTTKLYVWISYAQRNFSTALSGKDVPGFYAAVRQFVLIICVAAPLFSFTSWVEERLVLAWRAALTRHLTHAYFSHMSYYHMRARVEAGSVQGTDKDGGHSSGTGGIDNPDQRICDDVASFVRSSVSLTLSLARKLFNCIAFAGVLWSVSGQLVVFLFVYAAVGTLITTAVFGRPLTRLYFSQVAAEADMRFSLVRVRENAESIAFYRGETRERRAVLGRLHAALGVAAARVRWGAAYDVWTSAYNYATILVPSLLTAPRYFSGEIEFGVISQASYAFSTIESALSVIVNNLTALSGLAAETDRLAGLLDAVMACQMQGSAEAALLGSARSTTAIVRQANPQQQGVLLKGLSVVTPGGGTAGGAGGVGLDAWACVAHGQQLLARDLSLDLPAGSSLLVVGPSGCGKSSLMRALAGLWSSGAGTVQLPPAAQVLFVPQKPYMPLGTLRAQLTFPTFATGHETEQLGPDPAAILPHLTFPWTTPSHTSGSGSSRSMHAAVAGMRSGSSKSGSRRKQRESGAGSDADASADSAVESDLEADSAGEHELLPLLQPGTRLQATSNTAHSTVAGFSGGGGGGGGGARGVWGRHAAPPPDSLLLRLLEDCSLGDLADRVGGLDAELDWSSVLSAGEQQRLAIARLLLASASWPGSISSSQTQHAHHARSGLDAASMQQPNADLAAGGHRQKGMDKGALGSDSNGVVLCGGGLSVAFMDESTSALDGPTEARMYALIRERVPCYVSVGHRMALLAHHTHVLECVAGSGGMWQLHTATDYAKHIGISLSAQTHGTVGTAGQLGQKPAAAAAAAAAAGLGCDA